MISNVYSLPEIDFVGGSSVDLVFNAYANKDDLEPFGLAGCEANFAVIDYINKTGEPVISKRMSARMNEGNTSYNVLFVELEPSDTLELFGKYIYQITIRDAKDNVDIPQQGIIFIHNNINKPFLRT